MGQWSIIACVLGGLAGVLVFLRVVADELKLLDRALHLRKSLEAERQARLRALQENAR